jgi:hypothetical protein
MSTFKVKLNYAGQQGQLDLNPSTATPVLVGDNAGQYLGSQMSPSIQRSIFVAGPHRIYRELIDGVTFTDCNYWKRFAYPQVTQDQAFIQVVSDDGSIYSDFEEENNYPLVFSPYTVASTDTFTTNIIDILGTYGSFAEFVQLTNNGTSSTQDITVQLNGSSNAVFTLLHGTTQVFNIGDMLISKLAFTGGSASTTLQIILSVAALCNT